MGQLIFVSGTASNINYFSSTSGSVDVRRGRGSGSIKTSHSTSFRVDNRSIAFAGRPDIGEGDRVTVVGDGSRGVVVGYLVVNDSTNVQYFSCRPIFMKKLWGYLLAFFGFTSLSTMTTFGLILGGFGVWLIYSARQQKQAIYQLNSKSRNSAYERSPL
ncbi:MAG: hypothetical protein ACRC80_16425 [Waterburya sp.]